MTRANHGKTKPAPKGARKAQVIAVNRDHPDWTQTQIAEYIGASLDAVTSVVRRAELKVPDGRGGKQSYMTLRKRAISLYRLSVRLEEEYRQNTAKMP